MPFVEPPAVVKEPPLEKIHQNQSCLKRTCLTGCLGIVIFFTIGLIFLYFAFSPKTKELPALPGFFPTDLPLYDKDAITHITYQGGDRPLVTKILKNLPPSARSALRSGLKTIGARQGRSSEPLETDATPWWQEALLALDRSTDNPSNVIRLEWTNLNAEPRFIFNYLNSALKRENFMVTTSVEAETSQTINFAKNDLTGTFTIIDAPGKSGTDRTILTVILPKKTTP